MTKPSSQKKEQPMVRHMFSTQQKSANTGPDREDIERRAYELYLARGQADGYAIEDWQQAERELQARQP
ncbi:MAG TPA: DUF2934 domain-containing protein [Nitrospiraceae bacterium]|nr:DUF2934 domain-containing protein [Nitrospiraceae bacterium]